MAPGATSNQVLSGVLLRGAPKVQYLKVIQSIRNFHPDPRLDLTPEEQSEYCPKF
jgi:hypothetical protein